LISTAVALFEVQHVKTFQVFLKSLADERGSIQLSPLGRKVSGFQ